MSQVGELHIPSINDMKEALKNRRRRNSQVALIVRVKADEIFFQQVEPIYTAFK